jgi:hypothetical protein
MEDSSDIDWYEFVLEKERVLGRCLVDCGIDVEHRDATGAKAEVVEALVAVLMTAQNAAEDMI